MRAFHCTRCAQRVFFDNLRCESCGAALGYVPAERAMVSFDVDGAGAWQRLGPGGPAQRPCANYSSEDVCNWMVPADDPCPHCLSCRTTEIIPSLEKPQNHAYWFLLEKAKRRLFDTLLGLGLRFPDRRADPEKGLAFRFLEDTDPAERVLTGHDNGVITLNIAEADDARREEMRVAMHEPYRTLLGHFRHESGHYYWDRLIANTRWQEEYRTLFGDEQADYAQALQAHYANPAADWALNYVSSYASSHPWEDWAECWAHYLHMTDGLETAAAWGLKLSAALPGAPEVIAKPLDPAAASIGPSLVTEWLPVAQFANAMNRSLGLNDPYPFVIPPSVVAKLDFIHKVVRDAVLPPEAAPAPAPGEKKVRKSGRGGKVAARAPA